MRRAVENFLEDPLAEEFLRGNIKQGEARVNGNQTAGPKGTLQPRPKSAYVSRLAKRNGNFVLVALSL